MAAHRFEEMKCLVCFSDADARLLAGLQRPLQPYFRAVVDEFYDALFRVDESRRIIEAVPGRPEHVKQAFNVWLKELFCGRYDEDYYENRSTIGRMHVKAKLPQHYMFTAMNVVRRALADKIAGLNLEDSASAETALHKILDLELAIMNDTYREDLIRNIKTLEHSQFEQRLSESEHLATVGRLAASLAHEIKNPLTGISGAIQILGSGLDESHPHKEIINEVLHLIDRLDSAVKDLLIYARPKPPERSAINLSRTLDRAMLLLQGEPAFRNVNVVCEGLSRDVIVKADEAQIQQVISNLMLNAAHACRDGGTVSCRLESVSGAARLVIEDDGAGIPPAILDRVFEPFFTTKAKGSGLGLPICRRIVEAHDGTLQLESCVGTGTRAVFEIPVEA